MTLRQNITSKFTSKNIKIKNGKKGKNVKQLPSKQVEIIKIPSLILARPPKEILEKSKFFNKKDKQMKKSTNLKTRLSYAQVSAPKVNKILKLKTNYLNLLANKIYNIINNFSKIKLKINMTMKGPSRKQIIISMGNDSKSKFITFLSAYIANINSILKNIKSEVQADFIKTKQSGIVITFLLDLQTINNYIKDAEHINLNNVNVLYLLQSKFYLKIISIPYLMENTNKSINSSIIKTILKNNYIFDNISMASKPQIIKVFPKSDMVIVWLDI